jgi:ribosomal protein L11 methylase PrmA
MATTAETIDETHAEPTTPFLTIHGSPVYFHENWDIGIGGGLWSTGMAMALYFSSDQARASLIQQASVSVNNKVRVLELGSGNGILSVCLLAMAREYIDTLIITDCADHMTLMEATLEANQHLLGDYVNVQLKEHEWGNFENDIGDERFDLIIGTDVAYRPYLYDVLISSIANYSHSKTVSLIGVTMQDTTPAFFEKLKNAGFRYTRLNDLYMPINFRGTTFGIFIIQKKE